MTTRVQAARLLAPVLQRKQALIIPSDQPDAALCAELCYGTLRWLPRLSAVLELLLEKPLRAKDSDIQALLLIGLYQIEQMRTPDHAAVDQCVEGARQLDKKWAVGLINGVLRTFLRRRSELDQQLISIAPYRFAHPKWLIDLIFRSWPDQAGAVLEAGNGRPPMTLRVNQRRIQRGPYLEQLAEAGIAARAGQLASTALILEQPLAVEKLPGFTEGMVSVQDEAAQLCAGLMQLEPGLKVLDACAAPGGKACHILESCDCELTALDIDPARLARVEENLQRLGLRANCQVLDAGDPENWKRGALYDRILVDAPCSGTGVIRRHPDIKWLRTPKDVSGFEQQQLRLLKSLWPALKPNGLLLYVTCSIIPQENSELVQSFLASQTDALSQPLPDWLGLPAGQGRQLLPSSNGTDGFFYALIKKN